MNASPPRCAVTGSSCRLLQLELPDARPVWAVLDAAGARHFTGTVSLQFEPNVRVHFLDGEVYFAEREHGPTIEQILLDADLVTPDQLASGVVEVQGTRHLGRLFDRVPGIDRDAVELTVELLTATLLGEIADHTAPGVSIASYRHHVSGIQRWMQRPSTTVETAAQPVGERATDDDVATPARAAQDASHDTRKNAVHDAHRDAGHGHGHLVNDTHVVRRDVLPTRSIPNTVMDDVAALAQAVAEQAAAIPAISDRATPHTSNLTRVIEQVAAEGRPWEHLRTFEAEDASQEPIPDDVRAAVRLALAEIEASTRPAITTRLSMAALFAAGDAPPEPVVDQHPITNQEPVVSLLGR